MKQVSLRKLYQSQCKLTKNRVLQGGTGFREALRGEDGVRKLSPSCGAEWGSGKTKPCEAGTNTLSFGPALPYCYPYMKGNGLCMDLFIYTHTHTHTCSSYQSIANQFCHPILFYNPKKLFYQLYHTILQYTQHPKTLLFYHFIKILFFNLSLLFLSNSHFFFSN